MALAENHRSYFVSLLFLHVSVLVPISDELNMVKSNCLLLQSLRPPIYQRYPGVFYIQEVIAVFRNSTKTPSPKMRPTTPKQMNELDKVGQQTDNTHYQLYGVLRD